MRTPVAPRRPADDNSHRRCGLVWLLYSWRAVAGAWRPVPATRLMGWTLLLGGSFTGFRRCLTRGNRLRLGYGLRLSYLLGAALLQGLLQLLLGLLR